MPPVRKFKTGDKVYVPHTDKHYQAKVRCVHKELSNIQH